MKVKLPYWFSKFLRPENKSSVVSGFVMAVLLLTGLNGWSQCAPVLSGTSNITATTATVNWNAVPDLPATTYTLEVYTNAGLTASFGNYPNVAATSFNLTNLVNNTIYYYRVKTNNGTCTDFSVTGSFTAKLGYTPLDVTGFSADVIANGVGLADASSTHSVDSGSANNAYLCIDYKPLATSPTLNYGLPVNRTLNSPNITGLQYVLANYSGSNSLRLSATNDFGVLTLAQPQKLTDLYLAVASGDNESQISVEIQFADGTFQTANAIAVTNWDSNPVAPAVTIINNIGRVSRASGTPSTGIFKIFQIGIAVDATNHSKLVNAIKVTKTFLNSSDSRIPNIFAASGKLTPNCPVVTASATTLPSFTSATFNWALATLGTNGATAATYELEVYTDANFTTPIAGSPFTNLTATSQVVNGLNLDTTYYFRVRGTGGTCVGDYATGTYTHAYCTPTTTATTNINNITNFTTTGGYLNISNTSGIATYTNFTNQIVAKEAGASFSFTGVKTVNTTRVTIYVDWNKDLDFVDTGEAVYTLGTNSNVNFSGNIPVPPGTPDGLYRMRVRSSSSTAITPCGSLTNGDTEDYTLMVATQPANCVKPATPTLAINSPTASSLTVTASSATAPTGYLLVRGTQPVTGATPTDTTIYTVGTPLGSGTIVSISTSPAFTDFLASNSRFYYTVYAYNYGGTTCLGPVYSDPATVDGITCAKPVQIANASNITSTSALLNWSSVVGNNGTAATYRVEVYTDAAMTTQFGTAQTVSSPAASYALTGLTNGVTYYYRVKTQTAACFNDAWSATASFTAQNNYTPFTVTGFNEDVVANGNGIAKLSTTNDIDAGNNAYMSIDYERTAGAVTTAGLPVNRTLTSISVPALNFLFADYSASNSLRLPAQNQVGTLTLAAPKKLTNVYLALTSGGGGSTISSRVIFQDGTSQTPATSTTVIDWYQAGTTTQPALISNIGRANRADNVGVPDIGNAKVFYVDIPILAENQNKEVASIEITKTSTGATTPVPNVFAVSGKQIDECPVLASAIPVPAGNDATLNWALAAGSAAATSYTVEVFTNAALTAHVTGSPFTVNSGTTLNVTGLSASTQYYYRVRAVNAICSSAYQAGTFTTTCVAPAAPAASPTQALCGPSTVANLIATPVANATLNWYDLSTGGTALLSTAALTSANYYVSQSLNGCESPRTTVAITVTTLNAPTAAAQTVCTGTTFSQLAVTGATGATFTWSATQGGTAINGNTAVTQNTYFVTQTLNGCTSPATSVALTITTVNAPTAAAQTHCAGILFNQLTVTGATGATFTWSASQGGAAITGNTTVASGTYFVTQTVGTCTSAATQVVVTINTTPVPTASAQTFCIGATVLNLSAAGATGGTLTWSDTQAGDPLATTVQLVSGTYFVTQTLNTCKSTPVPVTVTVNSTAAPTATATQTFCIGATVANLTATTLTGATFKWSATQGGAALVSTAALASGTYYITQTLNTCESTATAVTVVVNSTAAPTASQQFFCTGETASQLLATTLPDATVIWSATEGGVALASNTALQTGTYYVRQITNECISPSTAVSVVVYTTAAPGAADQPFCAGATVENLISDTTTGAIVKWYSTLNGNVLDGSTLLETGTYYVTQTLNDCESTATEIQVTITTVTAPDAQAQPFCTGATVEDLVVNNISGSTVKWYSTEGGNVLGQATVLATGTYYVTQSINDCESTATEVQVTINAVDAPNAQAQAFCEGATAEELVANGETGAIFTWYATLGGQAITNSTILQSGTYYVTQTVGECTSTATEITVTINDIPDAPSGSATQSFEEGDTIADLIITTISGATVQWYTLAGNTYTEVNTDTVLEDGVTYYVSQTTETCESDYLAVTVSQVAGSNEFKFGQLSVSPNPTKDIVTVSNSVTISNIKVVNLLGQTVIEQTANADTVQVNLSSIASGTYILQVSGEGSSKSVKVIKH
ncbi:Ig-like domain-containing protein [Flavobacterium hauense]